TWADQARLAEAACVPGLTVFYQPDAIADPPAALWRSVHGVNLVYSPGTPLEQVERVRNGLGLPGYSIPARFFGLHALTDVTVEPATLKPDQIMVEVIKEGDVAPYPLPASIVTSVDIGSPPTHTPEQD